MIRTELHDSVETDFVHSILGRISAEPEIRGKEHAGHIGASLVQFGEALDHGISEETLGDGTSGDISEYWEHLFDGETGYGLQLTFALLVSSGASPTTSAASSASACGCEMRSMRMRSPLIGPPRM